MQLNRRGLITVATLLTLGVLSACESPMAQSGADDDLYMQSLVRRSVGNATPEATLVRPAVAGVREQVLTLQASDATSQPATQPGGSGAVTPVDVSGANSPISNLQGPAVEYIQGGETIVTLSLQDALARALKHSLNIKLQAYNPAIKDEVITEASAVFDAVLFGSSTFNRYDQPSNRFGGGANETLWSNQIGVKKLLSTGGVAQVVAGHTWEQQSQPAGYLYPRASTATVGLGLTQPLLKGFGPEVTQANIYLAQRDARISRATFRRQVADQVSKVEEAYYTLVQTRLELKVQEDLLLRTQETYDKVKAREALDADRVKVAQSFAAIQTRKANLIRAKAQVRTASEQLKVAMNDPELDLRDNRLIIPSDRPIDVPVTLNVADQIDIALRQRSELEEARLTIEKADVVLAVARNNLLPKLDMTLSTQFYGFSSDPGTAMGNVIDPNRFIDYTAGLTFEMPIGNRQAEAAMKRRNLEKRQALVNMLGTVQQVVLDVRTRLRELATTYQEIAARRSAREAAFEELDAILQKERFGQALSPEFLQLKLDAQTRLAVAEIAELQATVNYSLAVMRLELAKGTLLEYNRIAIDTPPEEAPSRLRILGQVWP